jgi:hypothetical protein
MQGWTWGSLRNQDRHPEPRRASARRYQRASRGEGPCVAGKNPHHYEGGAGLYAQSPKIAASLSGCIRQPGLRHPSWVVLALAPNLLLVLASNLCIPHRVEQAFMLCLKNCRIPHGVEQAFMPAVRLL